MTPEWQHPVGDAGRAWFEQQIRGHTRVRSLEALDANRYVIGRHNLPDVRLWLCGVYTSDSPITTPSESRTHRDAIVVLSVWNHYSPQADRAGKADGVGIFKPGELMSALHKEGDEFLGT